MKISLEQIRRQEGVDSGTLVAAVTAVDALVEQTTKTLRNLPAEFREGLYIGHSGGKDSVVIHWLMQQAFPNNTYPVLHTPKPQETDVDTIFFLYSRPFPIMYVPKEVHGRFGFKTQVDGSRRDEYTRTDGRSTHIIKDGQEVSREHMTMFVQNGLFGLNFVYPIVDWSNEDVWACIYKNQLDISPEYFQILL